MGQHHHVRITLNSMPVRSVGGDENYHRIWDKVSKYVEYHSSGVNAQENPTHELKSDLTRQILDEIPRDEYSDKISPSLSTESGDVVFIFIRRHKHHANRTIERMVHFTIGCNGIIKVNDILPETDDMTMAWDDPVYRMINDPKTWD